MPSNSKDLFPYLQKGTYKTFSHESEVHPSTGPHNDVKTYINPILAQSFEAGNSQHPKNAAAVKELYRNGEMYGWAVSVKTQSDSAGGDGWYWYEVFSTTDPSRTAADGNGVSLCDNCHSAGKDFILIGYPLK